MYNVLRMGKKAFTVSVVVATVAWSIGLAALLLPLAASAATLQSGDLIKASLPAVYYYGADGKRYVFPNKQTYDTWYGDFSGVKVISDSELAAVAIGGNVTYRPGVKMIKIQSDPKVYAVDKNGSLRWVNSEATATALYGSAWNTMIDDVSDAFFTNYSIGTDVTGTGSFDKASVMAASPNINVDKNLSGVAGGGGLSIAVDSSNPTGASMVVDSDTTPTEDSGQQRVPVLSLKLSASSGAGVNVSGLTFNRGGISKDGDVDNLYLMEGSTVLAEATSVNNGVGSFTNLGLAVAAGASRTVNLVMNLNKDTASGSTMNWSLSASNVVSDASSVSGSASGNSMTAVAVADLGQLDVGQTNTAPSSVDPGSNGKELWRVSFNAVAQDMLVTYVKFTNLGTADDNDIQNLKLYDGATELNGVIAKAANKEVVFDLTPMSGGGHTIKAGQSKQLTLVGDVVGGTNRNYKWTIQRGYDVRAKDLQYNVWAFVDDYDATNDDSFGVINQSGGGTANTATTINTGSLSVTVATDSPNTNVADEATGVTLAKFNFKASGEDVKVTDLTVTCTASTTTRALKNTKVMLDGVQVGSTDSSAVCAGATNVATYSFGNAFIAKLGVTHTVSIVADLNASTAGEAWAAGDTLWVGLGGTGAAQGKTSLTSITPSNQNGRTVTVATGTLTVIKDQSFGDRSATFPTGVSNAQGVKVGAFVVVGGAGEAVDVNQFVIRDDATNQLGDDYQNLVLKDTDGNQVGTTISSLNTTEGTYTFTPSTAIRLAAGQQKAFELFADVKGSVTNSATLVNGPEVDTVSAVGVDTGASANFGTAGDGATDVALQKGYVAIEGNLTVEAAADTPVAQQLVLGSTGVSLAKFKLTADSSESLTITEFTVADDMSTGNSSRKPATGTLKNLKLYNGSTLLASVSALDQTYNTQTPIATFTGFNLTVPSNQNLTLEVKADLTSFNDGGQTSSTHRLFVPVDTKSSTSAVENPVIVVGTGSGLTISGTSLDISAATDADVNGSYMDMVRAKLTLAHASDSPSGSSSSGSEQTVAKFVASNSSNVGNYSVYIRTMNFDVNHTGASLTQQSNIKVYKDSVSSTNQLISSGFCESATVCAGNFVDTSFTEAGFTDLEISAGSSRTIVVTLDTSGASMAANDTLSVGLLSGANGANLAPVQWDDGQTTDDYYTVNSLPLAGKTLVY